MTEDPAERRSLKSLDDRIRRARGLSAEDDKAGLAPSASALLSMAWRLAVELVVAPVVCGYIGWLLDYWLGSKPWFFVVFLLLGLITGGVLAYRAMQDMLRQGAKMNEDAPGAPPGAGEKRE